MREVLPGKFITFRGPVCDDWPVMADRLELLDKGHSTNSTPDYLDALKDKNVSTIIRLSSIEHSEAAAAAAEAAAAAFKRAAFNHFDLQFEECKVNSGRIVDEFMRIAEEARGVVAVQTHCLDGRARTGDELIALYLMKHHGFTAREAMCWIRICSPGTMLGPQLSASSLESASLSVISRASVVESFCSRADTICGAEHVDARLCLIEKVVQGGCMLSEGISAEKYVTRTVTAMSASQTTTAEALAHDTFLIAQSDLVVSYDDELGQGTTGTVYRGIVSNEVQLAVKVMNANMTGAEQQQALADLRQVFLGNALHPGIQHHLLATSVHSRQIHSCPPT